MVWTQKNLCCQNQLLPIRFSRAHRRGGHRVCLPVVCLKDLLSNERIKPSSSMRGSSLVWTPLDKLVVVCVPCSRDGFPSGDIASFRIFVCVVVLGSTIGPAVVAGTSQCSKTVLLTTRMRLVFTTTTEAIQQIRGSMHLRTVALMPTVQISTQVLHLPVSSLTF